MYICEDCGRMFDEAAEWQESRGEMFGQGVCETVYGCPWCYSTNYLPADGDGTPLAEPFQTYFAALGF